MASVGGAGNVDGLVVEVSYKARQTTQAFAIPSRGSPTTSTANNAK